MGKRSPILGYNHNVRYRGLVFHVQSEDSGVSTPHLFTHLFHHGVIVSTRKLVYDAGSAEESIKSLMQAQHKAVLKDLRRGHYDDKIDSYLGGTPGLEPRGGAEPPERPSEIELAPSAGTVEEVAPEPPTEQMLPVLDELSAPVMIEDTPPPRPAAEPPPIPFRPRPPLPFSGPRTTPTAEVTLKTEAPTFAAEPAPDIDQVPELEAEPDMDLSPEIEIQLEVDDNDEAVPAPRRTTRDTEMQPPPGPPSRPTPIPIPVLAMTGDEARASSGAVAEEVKRPSSISDGIPGPIRPSSPVIPPLPADTRHDSRRLGDRPSTINAATLPPARPISRPASRPALSPAQVVSRPVMTEDRSRQDSQAVEVYSPAPPSAELPGDARPGQYAQYKKTSTRIPIEGIAKERSGGVTAVPAGLGPPRRAGTSPTARPNSALPPSGSSPTAVPHPRTAAVTEPLRSRSLTPSRLAVPGAPNRPANHTSSGVVMTRPAVIVGAPAKTSATIPRIRKAREDEGRGFGQGLISEKSLDEVILAYLSEDADEK